MDDETREIVDVTPEIRADDDEVVDLPTVLDEALDSMKDSTAAFVYDGDREVEPTTAASAWCASTARRSGA